MIQPIRHNKAMPSFSSSLRVGTSLAATFVAVAFSSISLAQTGPAYKTVTDERLKNPEPQNWLMYRGTYDSMGYSALDQINAKNVNTLVPAWTFSTGHA